MRLLPPNIRTKKEPFVAMEKIAAPLETRTDKRSLGRNSGPSPPARTCGRIEISGPLRWCLAKVSAKRTRRCSQMVYRSGESGQTEAMVMAGQMVAAGKVCQRRIFPEAVVWFTKASMVAMSRAWPGLGECLLFGKGDRIKTLSVRLRSWLRRPVLNHSRRDGHAG